jgi:hypothetical protein
MAKEQVLLGLGPGHPLVCVDLARAQLESAPAQGATGHHLRVHQAQETVEPIDLHGDRIPYRPGRASSTSPPA